MGFLDKAKAAATDLAAKADTALAGSGLTGPKPPGPGDAEKLFRDLGVLAYLEATGRSADPAERQRVLTELQDLEARGAVASFALHTAPPPAPGVGEASPTWIAQPAAPMTPPPPSVMSVPPPPPAAPATTPPPPPPSWMTPDAGSRS